MTVAATVIAWKQTHRLAAWRPSSGEFCPQTAIRLGGGTLNPESGTSADEVGWAKTASQSADRNPLSILTSDDSVFGVGDDQRSHSAYRPSRRQRLLAKGALSRTIFC